MRAETLSGRAKRRKTSNASRSAPAYAASALCSDGTSKVVVCLPVATADVGADQSERAQQRALKTQLDEFKTGESYADLIAVYCI